MAWLRREHGPFHAWHTAYIPACHDSCFVEQTQTKGLQAWLGSRVLMLSVACVYQGYDAHGPTPVALCAGRLCVERHGVWGGVGSAQRPARTAPLHLITHVTYTLHRAGSDHDSTCSHTTHTCTWTHTHT